MKGWKREARPGRAVARIRDDDAEFENLKNPEVITRFRALIAS
jgi:hypothetical protein